MAEAPQLHAFIHKLLNYTEGTYYFFQGQLTTLLCVRCVKHSIVMRSLKCCNVCKDYIKNASHIERVSTWFDSFLSSYETCIWNSIIGCHVWCG